MRFLKDLLNEDNFGLQRDIKGEVWAHCHEYEHKLRKEAMRVCFQQVTRSRRRSICVCRPTASDEALDSASSPTGCPVEDVVKKKFRARNRAHVQRTATLSEPAKCREMRARGDRGAQLPISSFNSPRQWNSFSATSIFGDKQEKFPSRSPSTLCPTSSTDAPSVTSSVSNVSTSEFLRRSRARCHKWCSRTVTSNSLSGPTPHFLALGPESLDLFPLPSLLA